MTVGSYQLAIEDSMGRVIAVVERTSRIGRPLVGDEVVIDGHVHRVVRVRYEDEPDDRTVRRYQTARVFVRRGGPSSVRVLPLKRRPVE
jgi:hypothetical protein